MGDVAVDYLNALDELANWALDSSRKGCAVSDGACLRFSIVKRYAEAELFKLERSYGITLPVRYREFLVRIGASWLFQAGARTNSGVEFRRIEDICTFVPSIVSMHPKAAFDRYLPIGTDHSYREALLLDMRDSEGLVLRTKSLPTTNWREFSLEGGPPMKFTELIIEAVASVLVQRGN